MGPVFALIGRWALAGLAMSIGMAVGKHLVDATTTEDGWIAEGVKETVKDLEHTWTGRSNIKKEELPK